MVKISFYHTDDTVSLTPSKGQAFRKIYLTENKSAWLAIEWLSEELFNYAKNHYRKLFDLHPEERGKVILYNEEIQSCRWHRSYLNTPVRNPKNTKNSYMYSGSDFYGDLSLPRQFKPFLDFLNEKEENDQYNQVIANWYANGNDYIAAHSDCREGMKPEADIAIIVLYENEEDKRELQFIAKNLPGINNDAIYQKMIINVPNGCVIKMCGDTQLKFRHKVPKASNIFTSRMSLTFRKF